jgi:telomerase reverse transcriptase
VSFKTQESVNTSSTLSDFSPAQLPPRKPSLIDHATPPSQVSAFCRAVLAHLIPRELWGTGDTQAHNEKIFNRNVDRFVALRRFESLSLHEVSQGTKVSRYFRCMFLYISISGLYLRANQDQLADVEWLCPPKSAKLKLSLSDASKRLEIMHEFVYYVFDSILIPLIRTNFHVTESNAHRYRLLFFRQDVWRSIAEPEIASLKVNMFEEVKLERAQDILDSRTLGFSQVRLLPKETGVRPIMNLRRRTLKQGYRGMLGSSINTTLAPIYNVLTHEQVSRQLSLYNTG